MHGEGDNTVHACMLVGLVVSPVLIARAETLQRLETDKKRLNMGRRSWPSLGRHLVLRFRLHRRAQARSQLFGIPSAETVGRGSRASPLVWAHHPDSRFQKTLIVDAATNTSMGTWMRPCSLVWEYGPSVLGELVGEFCGTGLGGPLGQL